MKFKDHLLGIIACFGKPKRATLSCEIKKDYNDLIQYLRNIDPFKRTSSNIDGMDVNSGNIHTLQYKGSQYSYRISVHHVGNCATKLEMQVFCQAPNYTIKGYFESIEKKVKDYIPAKGGTAESTRNTAADYTSFDMKALVEELDKKITALNNTPGKNALEELKAVKNAIDGKVNELPVAERAKYTKPLSDIGMYIGTLDTQLSNPVTAASAGRFIGTYVSQMQTSASQLAAAL